jgi:nitrate reductase NapE component
MIRYTLAKTKVRNTQNGATVLGVCTVLLVLLGYWPVALVAAAGAGFMLWRRNAYEYEARLHHREYLAQASGRLRRVHR